jgi:hypothetical protein
MAQEPRRPSAEFDFEPMIARTSSNDERAGSVAKIT